MEKDKLILLLSHYDLPDSLVKWSAFGKGLIHQTFWIDLGDKEYILQGFNQNVFKFPERIEQNLNLLGQDQGLTQGLPFQLPLPILTKKGSLTTSFDGKLFRLFEFVDGATLQQIQNPSQAFLAAEAYASFSRWAEQFPIDSFADTIPNFHRLDLRYSRLQAVAKTQTPTSPEESEVLDFYLGQEKLIAEYLQTTGQIPSRLTHNDTKINNLIFSKNLSKVEAVIDLDTIMPGYLLYDLGDLVRTVANTEEETSLNWANQRITLPIYEQLLAGYLSGAANWISDAEKDSLLLGGEVMTCLMGTRFLTDHLEGNVYYHVDYPEQNFHRAKNQMHLLQSLQSSRPELQKILDSLKQKDKN